MDVSGTYVTTAVVHTELQEGLLDLLVKTGVLVKVDILKPSPAGFKTKAEYEKVEPLRIKQEDNIPCNVPLALTDFHRYVQNGFAIETNIENMSRESLGVVEDKKLYKKELQAAVKEYGHDEVLEAFYEWSRNLGTFIGRRPVTSFLKNVGNHIVPTQKPLVTSTAINKAEEHIAYVTENRVFFTGDYRIKLAALLKDYGYEVVMEAFGTFFQDVDEKNMGWASRNFLERAGVMINTILRKKAEVKHQEELLARNYAEAQSAAVPDEEEDAL